MRLTAVVTGMAWLCVGPSQKQTAADEICRVAWSPAASLCAQEVVELAPIQLRAVRGVVANEDGTTEWPKEADVVVELASIHDHSRRFLTHVRLATGTFSIPSVPEGEYCFRVAATPLGWNCVDGRVVVSSRAAKQTRLRVTLPLGK
jgi:hypothetical protein